jgi:hypothetical protein
VLCQAEQNEMYGVKPPAPGETTAPAPDEWPCAGCIAHVVVPRPGGGVQITDLWESTEDMQAFQRRMMPLEASLGLAAPANPPKIAEVLNYWIPDTP